MVEDYSQVTATLQTRVLELCRALRQSKWARAVDLAAGIAGDMAHIIGWIIKHKTNRGNDEHTKG